MDSLYIFIYYETSSLEPSGPPLSLTAFPISATDILVEWRVPATYEQNGVITRFTIIYKLDTNIERLLPVSDNSTKYCFLLTGLEEGSEYTISVAASTSEGIGPASYTQAGTFNTGMLYLCTLHEYGCFDMNTVRSIQSTEKFLGTRNYGYYHLCHLECT